MARLPVILLASTMLSGVLTMGVSAQAAPPPPPAAAPTSPAPMAPPAPPAAPAGQPASAKPGEAAVENQPPPAAEAAMPGEEAGSADKAAREKSAMADRHAMFEAHLAALHAGLTLTPEQDRLWPPVEQAIRDFTRTRAELRDARSDRMQDREDGDQDPIAALKVYSTNLLKRAQALHALSTAADPLYASLSEDQKHRLPMLLRDMAPHRGPAAKALERFDRDVMEPDGPMADRHGPQPDDRGAMNNDDRDDGPDHGGWHGRADMRGDRGMQDDRGDWHRRGEWHRPGGWDHHGWEHQGWRHGPDQGDRPSDDEMGGED